MRNRLTVLFWLSASIASGCGLQALNSFSLDAETYTEVSEVVIEDEGDERFAAALSVLQESCTSCHTHTHGFNSFSSEEEFINNYYVTAGSPEDSALYTRIRGAESGGIEDMPPDSNLAEASLTTIREWIERIGEEDEAATGDGTGGGGTVVSTKSTRLAAALDVISRRCASCHGDGEEKTAVSSGASGYSGQTVEAFADFETDQEFVSAGLIDYGNPETSWILRALADYGDIGTMPKSLPSVNDDDIGTLVEWIEGMDD